MTIAIAGTTTATAVATGTGTATAGVAIVEVMAAGCAHTVTHIRTGETALGIYIIIETWAASLVERKRRAERG